MKGFCRRSSPPRSRRASSCRRATPVTYRYKQPMADGSKPLEYGLIAEEVNEVYPELVAHNQDGQIETVQYYKLDAMLLNELQKQHRRIEEQRRLIESLASRVSALEAQISAQRSGACGLRASYHET